MGTILCHNNQGFMKWSDYDYDIDFYNLIFGGREGGPDP